MFGDEKNLKDTTSSTSPLQGEGRGEVNLSLIGSVSYQKTEKLITALYMVTDIIDINEPIRNKLRTLGTGIISDVYLIKQNDTGSALSFMSSKIAEIMSFLDIASTVNIISEMNCKILKKEFSELNQSILVSSDKAKILDRRINLSEFFASSDKHGVLDQNFIQENSKGRTSIGIQKGSTLLKALKHISVSDKNVSASYKAVGLGSGFDELKKQRRDNIIDIIRTMSGGATIKDIKDKTKTNSEKFNVLLNCSEKTLQRELISMVKDNVLNKVGEKRWSRYYVRL